MALSAVQINAKRTQNLPVRLDNRSALIVTEKQT